MELLAWHHHTGTGVPPDFEQAQEYYRRAISGGSWMATIGYARLLALHGHYDHCEKLLEDGVGSDFIPAYFWLAWFRHERSPGGKARRAVKPLLEYAADKGHPGAKIILGRWLTIGKFGIREIPRGIRLLKGNFLATLSESRG
ncbi:MAG: hypothetical protein WC729_23760 [Sphingomonas sp.]|uniref:hypothetical protein n=1 Tax=Sphingomonas sp. TaxID=28214 RepID=UPI003561F144